MRKRKGDRTGLGKNIGKGKNEEEERKRRLADSPQVGSDWGHRLREAGAEVVCCLCQGAIKVQNNPGFGSTTRMPFSPDTAKPRTAEGVGGSNPHGLGVRGVACYLIVAAPASAYMPNLETC